MATIKQIVNTRTSLSISSVATLAAGTYVASEIRTPNTNQPLDVILEVAVGTTNTPAGNKQVVAFILDSLDGTNFRSGPTSGTTTTDELDLKYLGVIPCNTSLGVRLHVATFSIANALGYVPFAYQLVLKNDLGVALTSATAATSEISMTVV